MTDSKKSHLRPGEVSQQLTSSTCPACQGQTTDQGCTVTCPICGSIHHIDCWIDHDGCVAEGCIMQNHRLHVSI